MGGARNRRLTTADLVNHPATTFIQPLINQLLHNGRVEPRALEWTRARLT
jgi:hypothetical protein